MLIRQIVYLPHAALEKLPHASSVFSSWEDAIFRDENGYLDRLSSWNNNLSEGHSLDTNGSDM
jgi:hypothetical protein